MLISQSERTPDHPGGVNIFRKVINVVGSRVCRDPENVESVSLRRDELPSQLHPQPVASGISSEDWTAGGRHEIVEVQSASSFLRGGGRSAGYGCAGPRSLSGTGGDVDEVCEVEIRPGGVGPETEEAGATCSRCHV